MLVETNLEQRLLGTLADVRAAAERAGCTQLTANADPEKGFVVALKWPSGDWERWGADLPTLVGHLGCALRLFLPSPEEALRPEELARVMARLGAMSSGAKYLFFTVPKGSLARAETGKPRTPLEALADGDFDEVMRAAHGYSER